MCTKLLISSSRPSVIVTVCFLQLGMQIGGISNPQCHLCNCNTCNRDLAIIMQGYDITQWWGLSFRVAEDEGMRVVANFQGLADHQLVLTKKRKNNNTIMEANYCS